MSDRVIQILLIEDRPADARLIQEALVEGGANAFELECAETLSAGIDRLLEGGIDVVLVDLSLPDSHGLDTFMSVRRGSPGVPVVVLTGLDDEEVAIQAVQAGAQDYLVKGHADANVLTRAIRYAIERHRLLAQLHGRTDELQSSREGLRKVVEKSANGIVIVGRDGVVRSANFAAGALLGRPCAELVGGSFEFTAVVGGTKEIDIGESEDGRKAAEMSVEEIEWDGEHARLVSLRDISDRRQVEEALGESEEEYRSLVENVNIGVYRNTGGPHGRFLKANPAVVKMLGYDSIEDFMNVSVSAQYQNPKDREEFVAEIARDGAVKEKELRLRKKDGTPIWASCTAKAWHDQGGQIKWIDGVIEDISERKRSEARSQAFASLGEKLSSATATKEAARTIVQTADELLGWDACFVMLYSPESRTLQPVLFMDHVDGNRVEIPAPSAESVGSPLAQQTIDEGAKLILRGSPAGAPTLGRFGNVDRPSASLMSVPVRHFHVTLGVLSIQSYQERAYDRDDLDTLQALADHCGGALERIWAEEAVRASEAKYRQLVETLTEGVWVIDREAHTTFVNPRMAEMLGYTVEEMLGKHLFTFMDDRGVEICKRLLKRRRQGVEEQHDFEFLRKDGARMYTIVGTTPVTDRDGDYAGAIAGVQDVTERRRAEDALRASEALSRTTIGAIDEGIHVVGPDLRIVLFNDTFRRWCKELGLESDMVGRTVLEAFPFLSDRVRDDYRHVLETGEPLTTEETHVIAGREIVTETRRIPVVHEGEVTQVVTAVHDITERRRMEREILDISGREQQRIGQDLHDGLCQHLTGIAFMARTLAGRLEAKATPEAEDVAQIKTLINDAIVQARGLVRGLSPVDLGAGGLRAALEELAASTGDLFGMSCTSAGDASVAIDDSTTATHIYRIAQEAVNNAVKHSKAKRVMISLTRDGEQVELAVRDDGVGLPDVQRGAGMGLRIMGYRAKMIGGSLRVDAAGGGGTVVRCSLQFPKTDPKEASEHGEEERE